MDTRKLDANLAQAIDTPSSKRINVFVRFKRPPRENDPVFEKLDIRGANGNRKVLTATLSKDEIDIVSEMRDVVTITQSTKMHPSS